MHVSDNMLAGMLEEARTSALSGTGVVQVSARVLEALVEEVRRGREPAVVTVKCPPMPPGHVEAGLGDCPCAICRALRSARCETAMLLVPGEESPT